MADDVATTALVFDARPAQKGAADYQAAGEKIIAANKNVEKSIAGTRQAADSFGVATNRVATSLSTQTRQLDTFARRFDPLGAAVRKATKDLTDLQRIASGTGENAARAAAMIAAAETRLKATQGAAAAGALANATATTKLQGAVTGLSNAWGIATRAAAALGITLGVAGLVAYTKQVIDTVGGLGELAEQMGISVRALQAYQFAAVQGGISTEQLDTAITKFGRKIGDAAKGNKEAVESFKDLGVKLLDLQRRLRPTEDVLSEVARAILAMEDPAKRTAAEMEFFGRSGAKLAPILKELAGGTDEMARKAAAAGAMIDERVVEALDKMGDSAAVAHLKFRALAATLIAEIGTGPIDSVTAAAERLAAAIKTIGVNWSDVLTLPGFMKLLLGGIVAANPSLQKLFSGEKPSLSDLDKQIAGLQAPGFERDPAAVAELQRLQAARAAMVGATRQGGYGPAWSTGAGRGVFDPKVTGAGADTANRIAKATADAQRELEFAQKIAEASKISAEAVADLQMQFEAAKKAAAAFGDEADKNKAAVDALAKKLYEAAAAADKFKAAAKFNLETQEIERGNELLEAELRLLNAAPEVRAKEIALIKVRNQLTKEGLSEADVDYQRRLDAVKVQTELNQKLEESRKAQEAMAEPMRNAVQSLQTYIVEGLTGGFTNARAAILGIWKRLMAELAVATVIRPIILAPVMSLLGSAGLVPQSVAAQYGGSGALGAGGGGLGGLGIPGLGGGNLFGGGGIGGFLSTPIFGPSSAAFEGVIPGMSGADAASYFNGLSGGPTIGTALGGIAGIGMGIYGLTQGNTIGGISGILGGGLGLLSMAPGLGFLGPIGMGIGLLGGLLGGLFGQKKPKTPQGVSNLAFGPDGWFSSTAMSRGGGNLTAGTGKASDALGSQLDLLAATYGLQFAQDAIGGWILNSIGKNTGNQWMAGLGAYGSRTVLPAQYQNTGDITAVQGLGSAEEAVGILAAMILKANAAGGQLTGLTGTQRTIIDNADLQSIEDIKRALDFSQVYDDLVRGPDGVTAMEKAVRELNTQFRGAIAQAKDYGLETAIIEQRRVEAINKLATDTNEDYRRRILGMTPEGALAVTLEDLEKVRLQAVKEAQYLNETVTGALVDINQIEEYYAAARVKIIEDANAQANASLEQLWRRLTYGDLSAASPLGTLEGTRSAYQQALLEAQGGSLTARANLAGFAEDYVRAGYMYQGSNAAQAALVSGVASDIAPFFTANGNMADVAGAIASSISSYSSLWAEQQATVTRLIERIDDLMEQNAVLVARLDRVA